LKKLSAKYDLISVRFYILNAWQKKAKPL